MKAVILAAGEGNRIPLTHSRPKVMLRIANKPLVEHLVIAGEAGGIKEYIFIVGYRDDQVREYFGDGERNGECGYSTGYSANLAGRLTHSGK
jgi:bifunctional UDP-N-acetylglucosamine pyrophosphorylase/glucosamine-1-phosphate N-acetyltransferase